MSEQDRRAQEPNGSTWDAAQAEHDAAVGNEEQEQAVLLAAQMGRNWLAREYADDLTGKQMRAIAAGLIAVALPVIKAAVAAQIADALHDRHPEIGSAILETAYDYLNEVSP